MKPLITVKIELNPNKERDPNKNILPNQYCQLFDLIRDRYSNFHETSNPMEDYRKYRRYDSILIDGTRGTGKSTMIEFLYHQEELKSETKILPVIDPNQLDRKTKILDIVIDNIFECIQNERKNTDRESEDIFHSLCRLKNKIDRLSFFISREHESVEEMSRTTKEERTLDETIHLFATQACRYLGKKVLIQPIDDIDMQIEFGSHILETIRKYLQTPRIIPIVALDSGQIYALIKQQYFEKLGYDAKTPLEEISAKSEMTFLKKLPSEYIQKILPPCQRVVLPDMLDIYRDHLSNKKADFSGTESADCRHKQKYILEFSGTTADGTIITLSFEDLLQLMMNILFGFHDKKAPIDPLDFHAINYLKNKTFRSFMDDARALISGLYLKDNHAFSVDKEGLKNRFRLYSKSYANNRYDAAKWFWDSYIDRLYDKLEAVRRKAEFEPATVMNLDIIEEVLIVNPEDSSALGRKEKTYYRIFLQEFFIEEITVKFNEDFMKVQAVSKSVNIPGYLEFIIRTVFPAALFELLYNEGLLSLESFPIERLKHFAESDAVDTLSEIYDQWVPLWLELYGLKDKKRTDLLGMEIEEYQTRSFRKQVFSFSKKEDIINGSRHYFLHPFKLFAFLAEFNTAGAGKNVARELIYRYMPSGYLNQEGGRLERIEKFLQPIAQLPICMTFESNGFGIISSLKHIRRSVGNIAGSLLSIPELKENFFHKLRSYELSDTATAALFKIESKKYMAVISAIYLNALIINIMESYGDIENEDVSHSILFNIQKDFIHSGLKENNILLPFIIDDPFVRNMKLFSEFAAFQNDKNILQVIKRLFLTLELEKTYIFDPRKHKRGEENHIDIRMRKEFIDSDSITLDIKRLLGNSEEITNAYMELFHKIIFPQYGSNNNLLMNVISAYTDGISYKEKISLSKMTLEAYDNIKSGKDFKNIDNDLYKRTVKLMNDLNSKINRLDKKQDYFERNAHILFLDAIVYYPDFISIFGEYLKKQGIPDAD